MKICPQILYLFLSVCFLVPTKAYSSDSISNISGNAITLHSSVNQMNNIKLASAKFIVGEENIDHKGYFSCKSGEEWDGQGHCKQKCDLSKFPLTDNTVEGCIFEKCDDISGMRYACTNCHDGYEMNHITNLCEAKECHNYPLTETEIVSSAGNYECQQCGDKKKCRYTSCDVDNGWIFENHKCIPNNCDGKLFSDEEAPGITCVEPRSCSSAGKRYFSCEQCQDGYELENGKCIKKNNKDEEPPFECFKYNTQTGGFDEVDVKECDCEHYDKRDDQLASPINDNNCASATYVCYKKDSQRNDKGYIDTWVSKECAACQPLTKMNNNGQCEDIPCEGPENTYWFGGNPGDESYTSPCKKSDYCKVKGVRSLIFDDGYDHGITEENNFEILGRCTECKNGYSLINNACVADSGVGSLYKYNDGKAIGIIIYEDEISVRIMALEDLEGSYSWVEESAVYGGGDGSKGDGIIHNKDLFVDIPNIRNNETCALEPLTSGVSPTNNLVSRESQAGKAARDYAPVGYSSDTKVGKGKWYLPSAGELKLMGDLGEHLNHAVRAYNNLIQIGTDLVYSTKKWRNPGLIHGVHGKTASGNYFSEGAYYWSSSEASEENACRVYVGLNRDRGSLTSKDVLGNVRPVLVIYKENPCITTFGGMSAPDAAEKEGCAEAGKYSPAPGVHLDVCVRCKKGYCVNDKTGYCEKRDEQ